jgi:AcrR family transcriptional regulator
MKSRPRANLKRSPARREKRRDREREILAAAFEVFAAHGFEATRIDDVAQRAGIAKGTVYLYFRDKERLFQAVVRNLLPKRLDLLVEALPGSTAELLPALVGQFYSHIVRNPQVPYIFRMLVAESGRFPQLAEIYHREIIAPGLKALRKVLERGVAEGLFRKSAAMKFPQIIAAAGLLAMMWQLLFGRHHPLDLDAYQKAHVEWILRGLDKPGLSGR